MQIIAFLKIIDFSKVIKTFKLETPIYLHKVLKFTYQKLQSYNYRQDWLYEVRVMEIHQHLMVLMVQSIQMVRFLYLKQLHLE
jgi:hypothetical protein